MWYAASNVGWPFFQSDFPSWWESQFYAVDLEYQWVGFTCWKFNQQTCQTRYKNLPQKRTRWHRLTMPSYKLYFVFKSHSIFDYLKTIKNQNICSFHSQDFTQMSQFCEYVCGEYELKTTKNIIVVEIHKLVVETFEISATVSLQLRPTQETPGRSTNIRWILKTVHGFSTMYNKVEVFWTNWNQILTAVVCTTWTIPFDFNIYKFKL